MLPRMSAPNPAALGEPIGATLPLWSVAPFVALILGIALLPLFAHHWWERSRNQFLIAVGLAAPVGVAFWFLDRHALEHALVEYLAFIALLGSLFTVSGGIALSGKLRATPLSNTLLLLVGAVVANVIGTTGASMLLIRPFLEMNAERERRTHLPIFFIFLVSNIGGCLTPIGDPPLFLGYLRGVPFTWTLSLFPEWLFCLAFVLVVFYALDVRAFRLDGGIPLAAKGQPTERIRLLGRHNLVFLALLVGAVFLPEFLRIAAMGAIALASLSLTNRAIRERNMFSFGPIREVAILFFGIFVTLVPALLILEARGDQMGLTRPWQFFWLTGVLSSFLDNAPTYVAFTSIALSTVGVAGTADALRPLAALVDHDTGVRLLQAISLGAVFMGANTYIGNGPNFMVRAITESRGTRMPSFFGYMAWSGAILIPCFVLVTLLFFR